MKKLALIAALVSTAAIAQADDRQWQYDHHGDYDRHTDEGRREGQRYDARNREAVPLAAMNISHRRTVDVGLRAGQFSALRLQAVRGVAYVDFVEVRFGNGDQQHIDVHRRIGAGEVADIDTRSPDGGGRYIQAVTVHGRPDRWSRIQLTGLR